MANKREATFRAMVRRLKEMEETMDIILDGARAMEEEFKNSMRERTEINALHDVFGSRFDSFENRLNKIEGKEVPELERGKRYTEGAA